MRANSTQPGGSGWARCWIEGAGAALLLAPGYIWNQLSWTHLDLYHRLLPITPVVRALAIDVAVLWLLATLVVRLLGWAILRLGGEGLLGPRRGFIGLLWALWLGLLAARIVAGLIVAQVLTWQELSAARAFAAGGGDADQRAAQRRPGAAAAGADFRRRPGRGRAPDRRREDFSARRRANCKDPSGPAALNGS